MRNRSPWVVTFVFHTYLHTNLLLEMTHPGTFWGDRGSKNLTPCVIFSGERGRWWIWSDEEDEVGSTGEWVRVWEVRILSERLGQETLM